MPNTSLASKILKKDKLALSRAISIVENRLKGYKDILSELYPYRKSVCKIGVTGPPGAGKSTITSKLSKKYIDKGKEVGVICVDPSSSFNGGAILGDRIRMNEVYMSDSIFIRSIATRGSYGGLSDNILDIEILYEAFGFDVIIYETVGVGQIELDIMNCANTVVLVITPESGDDIQMMKAGLIECASIIVINKSDRDGADKINTFLEQYLRINDLGESVPVIKTIAIKEEGIGSLISAIKKNHIRLKEKKELSRKDDQKYRDMIAKIASENLLEKFMNEKRLRLIDSEVGKSAQRRMSPYNLFEKIK